MGLYGTLWDFMGLYGTLWDMPFVFIKILPVVRRKFILNQNFNVMLKKISMLVAGSAFVVAISLTQGSHVLIPKAMAIGNHKKNCWLREGCKPKTDSSCFGSMCKQEPL